MSKEDIVIKKIEDAYAAFKKEILALPPSEIFDRAYKIFSIEEIYMILVNGYDFDEEDLERILSFSGNVLEQIYSEWIDTDFSHQDEFFDIIDKTLKRLSEGMCAYAA